MYIAGKKIAEFAHRVIGWCDKVIDWW